MKYASFDLEITNIIKEYEDDWWQYSPLGISCAAWAGESCVYTSSSTVPGYNESGGDIFGGEMPKEQACDFVNSLISLSNQVVIVTWNGASFDFRVLAEASGMHDECVELALDHWDIMLQLTTVRGHWLGLQKVLHELDLTLKLDSVRLSDGTTVYIDGAAAPKLWANGEHNAVLKYLAQDVKSELELANRVSGLTENDSGQTEPGIIRWSSDKGWPQMIDIGEPMTVRECLAVKEEDRSVQSWITDPKNPHDMTAWMRGEA